MRDDAVPCGEIYSFSGADTSVSSDALIDNEKIGDLLMSYFDFQLGDIVRLPDGRPLSIGKKIEEGLMQRGTLVNAYALDNNTHIPLYKSIPSILIKIQKARSNGTMIRINNKTYRLFDRQTLNIELNDRSGETGYIINLADFDCSNDGIYEVYIDVPNDRTNRVWKYAYIKDIEYNYEDSPYIFKTRGTIAFNEQLQIKATNKKAEQVKGENIFNFIITPNENELQFTVISKRGNLDLCFSIPVLNWRFGNDDWQIEKPTEIWHRDFPTKISFMYPDDRIKLCMDEQFDNEDDEEQSAIFYKLKEKGIFECDVTRFKSWFGREQALRHVYIDFPSKHIPFIDVITKSIVVSSIIKGDFDRDALIGEFDIIGQARYYANIEFHGEIIASMEPLKDGKIEVTSKLQSGKYKVSLFEDEEDDTGFGDANYLPIGERYCELLNPLDLQGKSIQIKHIKKGENSMFNMPLSCNYKIINLYRTDKEDKHNYQGKMIVETSYGKVLASFPANVKFYNINKLKYVYITFFDGEELTEFLYDNERKHIVKDPLPGLTRAQEYRRYSVSLFPIDYLFVIEFIETINEHSDNHNIDNNILINLNKLKTQYDIAIADIPITDDRKEVFKANNILTIGDAVSVGISGMVTNKKIPYKFVKELTNLLKTKNIYISTLGQVKATLKSVIINGQNVKINDVQIKDLSFSVNTFNRLQRIGCKTLQDIVLLGKKNLCETFDIGNRGWEEIEAKLRTMKIIIGDSSAG